MKAIDLFAGAGGWTEGATQAGLRGAPMKVAKVGRCWHCGALTAFRCARCHKFVCVIYGSLTPSIGCARLVKARSQVGVYRLVCWPKCVKRRDPRTLERLKGKR